MQQISFLQDLAVVMLVAGLVTILFHHFKQPVVLGYILAGFMIGPHTPPFPLVQDQETINTLADLGVTFLVFSLGMQFSIRQLRTVGNTAFIASSLEMMFMLFVGYHAGRWFGWSRMDSIFLGAMLSITSTTVIIKTLDEFKLMKAPFAQRIFGIQIIEDILGMTTIGLLVGLATTGTVNIKDGLWAIANIAIFVIAVLIIGLIAVPRLIRYVARFRSDEMLLITVLGLLFGVTFAAVRLEHSLVLGAFLIGTIIGETREIVKIKILTEPVRDMFSAIFFVTIGMLIDPKHLIDYAFPILVITFLTITGKIFIFSTGAILAGNTKKDSLRIGLTMIPIGELSFIIATLGLAHGVTSDFLYPIAVSVAAITIPLTPYLARNMDRIISTVDRWTPPRINQALEVYYMWTRQLQERRTSMGMKLARRWLWQILLNVALIAGLFLTAAYLVRATPEWLPRLNLSEHDLRAMYWLCAVLASLPFYVATLRKIMAIGMLVAEVSVANQPEGGRRSAVQGLISHAILIVGIILLGLCTLALSAAFLPAPDMLIVLGLLVGLVAWLTWRRLIFIHARMQGALYDTFMHPSFQVKPDHHTNLAVMLSQAELERLPITPEAPSAGKLLSEIQLRTQSGASAVAIERGKESIVNPGPEEEICAGDVWLLIGTAEQIKRARTLLCGDASSAQ